MARKILLADDSVTAQNMGRRILTDAGYEVITVNNGSAALKKIADAKPDLIVLDVYMPGYGGLEVCQRLKEAPETARIPVLLTVGKLEPFKAEEARRVQADAFIIKPFEASELLAALSKLEDRVVPQAKPQKSGRLAKAIASIEEAESPAKQFGDSETGWKNRLTIPGGKTGHGIAAVYAESKTSAPSLPPDITAEEIAALTAAAAALEVAEEVQAPETEAPHLATGIAEPAPEVEASTQPTAAMIEEEAQAAPPAAVAEETAPEVEHALETPAPASIKTDDAEVLAALATLAPVTGKGTETAAFEAAAHASGNGIAERVNGTANDFAAAISQPHWIAEPIAATEVEAGLILEQEMEKTFAAFAAASAPLSAERESPMATSIAISDQPAETVPAAMVPPTAAQAPVVEAVPEAAYAVAAAASSAGADSSAAHEPEHMDSSRASEPVASAEQEEQREPELAAAWANWKQIRESLLGSPFGSQIADAAAAELEEKQKEAAAAVAEPEAPATVTSSVTPDASAIASIVDSVLAELKPKLVEEIAKKMSKPK